MHHALFIHSKAPRSKRKASTWNLEHKKIRSFLTSRDPKSDRIQSIFNTHILSFPARKFKVSFPSRFKIRYQYYYLIYRTYANHLVASHPLPFCTHNITTKYLVGRSTFCRELSSGSVFLDQYQYQYQYQYHGTCDIESRW